MLLLRCFFRFLAFGKADKEIGRPKSVLIIQRGKFGDMIATTPMFRAIKTAYPDCRVAVMGNKVNQRVLAGNLDVDEYLVWDDDIARAITNLCRKKYDFACVTGPNFESLALLYLSGIPQIAAPVIRNGWSPYETKSYKIIVKFVIQKEHWMKRYVPREFLKLLEPIGIFTDETKKYIYWSKEAEATIQRLVSSIDGPYRLLVGIMPGAGNKVKQWPAERFGAVADYLIEKYNAWIVIIGGEAEKEEISKMLVSAGHKERITNTIGTSVDELKALVSKMDFTVSVDTGPVFIAEASGVPTIDIAGSIHPNEMAPNDGQFHLLIQSEGEPQIWTMNARIYDYAEARRQIESITVSMVTETIDKLIKKLGKK